MSDQAPILEQGLCLSPLPAVPSGTILSVPRDASYVHLQTPLERAVVRLFNYPHKSLDRNDAQVA